MSDNRTCSTCRHWHRGTTIGQGQCRRNAPSPTLYPAEYLQMPLALLWPVTRAEEGCGEHAGNAERDYFRNNPLASDEDLEIKEMLTRLGDTEVGQ